LLRFDELEAIRTIEALAAGAIDEPTLAAWFRKSLN
jgi:hypothetical protein